MIIQNSNRMHEKFMAMAAYLNVGTDLNAIILDNLYNEDIIPEDMTEINELAEKLKGQMQFNGQEEMSVEKIRYILIVEGLLRKYITDDYLIAYIMSNIAGECIEFESAEFSEDPFIKNITFDGRKTGDIKTAYEQMKPLTLDVCGAPKKLSWTTLNIPVLGCYKDTVNYPVIVKSGTGKVIRSITPAAKLLITPHIAKAKGKVLCLGAGIGYFAYMASEKTEVESVTVVDNNEDVLAAFEELILPQFGQAGKIKVVKADPAEFFSKVQTGEYDYCFVDIFNYATDTEKYFEIKSIARNLRKTVTGILYEDMFASSLSSCAFVEFMETYLRQNNQIIPETSANFPKEKERPLKYIHRLMKNEKAQTPEEVDRLLDPGYIISLINKSKIEY